MSDGTLRALGVLTAVFQRARVPLVLVGIEEPEIALHPGAAAVLRECLVVASRHRQVVVTSHSPELLDAREWKADQLRAVQMVAAVAMPILVERLVTERLGVPSVTILRPSHRMKRHQMVKEEHLSKAVELQARRVGPQGSILITLNRCEADGAWLQT
jgi:predicted ATPase